MSDTETLAETLRSEFEAYLSALREEEVVKKWLNNERFQTMLEEHEASVRRTLNEFIENYTKRVPNEGPYRQAVLAYSDAALRVCLDACKRMTRVTVDAMVRAFGEYPQISA